MSAHTNHEIYRFCSRCGETMVQRLLKAGEPERPVCVACGYVVYLDPKVTVGTIISNADNQVALVRRAIEPAYGKWGFPGGYVDRGETLIAAAAREAWEEARLEIRIDGLVNIYSYSGQTSIVVVYGATSVGGQLRAEDESLEAAWFSESDVPWPELAFPSTGQGLREFFQGILWPHVV
jgi:ADP-ribose pyrophosphatase YjhB (NUDIX family)